MLREHGVTSILVLFPQLLDNYLHSVVKGIMTPRTSYWDAGTLYIPHGRSTAGYRSVFEAQAVSITEPAHAQSGFFCLRLVL